MPDTIVLPTHPLFKNLTGQIFGRLTVVGYAGRVGAQQVSAWLTGLPHYTIQKRLAQGWPVSRALTTPKRNWSRAA